MSLRTAPMLATAALALLLVVPAGADAATTAPTEFGHWHGLDVDALVKARYTIQKNTGYNQEDQNGFRLVDTRLGLSGEDLALIGPGTYFFEIEAELSSGTLELKNGYGGWQPIPELGLAVGQLKVPFAWAVVNSTPRLMFFDRALAEELGFGYDRGIRLGGTATFGELAGRDVLLSYAAGVFNGIGVGLQRNINERYLYAGRLLFEPLGALGADESDLDPCARLIRRAPAGPCDPERPLRLGVGGSVAIDTAIATGEPFEVGREELRYAVEAHLKVAGLAVHGELVLGRVGDSSADPAFGRLAYYAQAGYALPFAPWLEPTVRSEFFDINDARGADDFSTAPGANLRDQVPFSARRRHSAGLNFYLSEHRAKLQLAYVLTDLGEGVRESPQGDPLVGDQVIVQAQVSF